MKRLYPSVLVVVLTDCCRSVLEEKSSSVIAEDFCQEPDVTSPWPVSCHMMPQPEGVSISHSDAATLAHICARLRAIRLSAQKTMTATVLYTHWPLVTPFGMAPLLVHVLS